MISATLPVAQSANCQASVRTKGILYLYKLVNEGIPFQDARVIAAAIAKYDAANRLPKPHQRELIMQYSPLICRAHLWRSELLLKETVMV